MSTRRDSRDVTDCWVVPQSQGDTPLPLGAKPSDLTPVLPGQLSRSLAEFLDDIAVIGVDEIWRSPAVHVILRHALLGKSFEALGLTTRHGGQQRLRISSWLPA